MDEQPTLDVLIVEDDVDTASALQRVLERADFKADNVQSLTAALERVRQQPPAVLLLDLSLPDGDGVDAIRTLSEAGVGQIIVISGTDDAERTRRCLQAGVFDFLVKPAQARDLLLAVRRADAHRRKSTVATRDYPPELTLGFGALEGKSKASQELFNQLRKVGANAPCPALIVGQPGVLKDDVAALLHQFGKRPGRAYVISCASESGKQAIDRFFGDHADGDSGKAGGIEAYLKKADGGTLVLDDVSTLSMDIQRRLKSFMISGKALASNALTPTRYDCSIVGILREPAEVALAEGRLYDPFYYTMAKNTIRVPPLVERKEDIELFARLAVDQLNRVFDSEKSLSAAMLEQLRGHYWPGNQVELKNTLLTAYRLTEDGDEIGADPTLFVEGDSGVSDQIAPFIGMAFKDVEEQLIKATLVACDNNKSQSAKVLGISLKTLYNRLNRYEEEQETAVEG